MQDMAKAESPPRFNRGHFYDPNFTAEITAKMQVPKRIRVTGVVDDDEDDDFDRRMNWQPEKIDMRVPDRILVTGEDGHIGTPATPREIIVENTVMPPDPGLIRVQTPPRSITLEEHYFPTAAEDYALENDTYNDMITYNTKKDYPLDDSQAGYMLDRSLNQQDYSIVGRSNGPFLKTEEEIVHLRKQLVKMNRRVLNIEREIMTKHQRDKIVFGLATAYLVIKIFMWMNRNS